MPNLLPNLDKEHWKYSNVNAVLSKMEVAEASPVWEMTGAYEFIVPDSVCDVHLRIPKNKQVTAPIELKLAGKDGERLEARVVIEVEEGAEAIFIERQAGAGAYWKNISLSFKVGKNARVSYYRLCEEDPFCVVTEFVTADLARDARFNLVVVNGCSGFGRSEFTVNMDEAGAEADLAGLALLRGKQHGDTTVCVNHIAPHCKSSQFFKTILEDRSRGVYQGKIHVYKDAQKTDGYQLSNNLILSPLAEMDVKPELEIYADDVKCSHGTTTGELDETPMFYLMSRGIDEAAARHLLIEAFTGEITEKVEHDEVRALLEGRVKWWLK
ncbi:MAG TPA: Fe-S cluster assembly protein SufD [Alphaproteobacteria bacterium]|nr:Fe-S cluster assembly protein SufD [Alphaproteobacteria bacterium]HNS44837.1 Fe-S cluster assembly protein SufD [Alphaproteobacteria bacterium]